MDPVTAFGLACTLVQMVQTGLDVVSICRRILKEGSTVENKMLESLAQHMINISGDLEASIVATGALSSLSKGDRELRNLAKDSCIAAKELVTELQDLIPLTKGLVPAVRKTILVLRKQGILGDLNRRLAAYQKALDTGMLRRLRLITLYEYSERHDALLFQQAADFDLLHQSVKVFVKSLAEHRTESNQLIVNLRQVFLQELDLARDSIESHTLDLKTASANDHALTRSVMGVAIGKVQELSKDEHNTTRQHINDVNLAAQGAIERESVTTRQHVTQSLGMAQDAIVQEIIDELSALKVGIQADSEYRLFYDSLYFPEITARQDQIPDAHAETFQWIFHERPSIEWDNFVFWLKEGHGVYWINGKAGSGKSTLMNYICQDCRTREALQVWQPHSKLVISKFFFWNSGSTMQKSTLGLLRSLVYQVLKDHPALTLVVARDLKISGSDSLPGTSELGDIPSWTEKKLLQALRCLLQQSGLPLKFCMFIDGLDEYEGIKDDLIQMLCALKSPNVKFCVSSRSWHEFELAFGSGPKLRLQDLTRQDIEAYVSDSIRTVAHQHDLATIAPHTLSWLVNEVVKKADGVFLWVTIVVQSLKSGLQNMDDVETLHRRLEKLPSKVGGLYVYILQQLDEEYRQDAAAYFVFLEACGSSDRLDQVTLLDYAIFDYLRAGGTIQSMEDSKKYMQDWIYSCKRTKVLILTRCVGLLEVEQVIRHMKYTIYNKTTDSQPPDRNELVDFNGMDVVLLHQTVHTFLTNTGEGRRLLESSPISTTEMAVWRAYVLIGKAVLMSFFTKNPWISLQLRRTILIYASEAEAQTGRAQMRLMESIDETFTHLHDMNEGVTRPWCHENPGDLVIDFLGNAAYHGCHLYVKERLDANSFLKEEENLQYLLSCAVTGMSRHVNPSGNLQMVDLLLQYGADPDARVSVYRDEGVPWLPTRTNDFRDDASPWVIFLNGALRVKPHELSPDVFARTALAFLKQGADANAVLELQISGLLRDAIKTACAASRVTLHQSVRSIIEGYVREQLNHSDLEDFLVDVQAERVTHFVCETAGGQTVRAMVQHERVLVLQEVLDRYDFHTELDEMAEHDQEVLKETVSLVWRDNGLPV